MVKKSLVFLLLIIVMLLLGAAFWLRSGEHEIGWARPWVVEALNPEAAPYSIAIGKVSVNWTNLVEFGRLRVEQMIISQKADGAVFAELPEVHLTLDPIGFLPHRRALHGIAIDNPRLYLVRDGQGIIRVGIDGTGNAMAVKDLFGSFAAGAEDDDATDEKARGLELPFRQFAVQNAHLSFRDEASDTNIVGEPFNFRIQRARGTLEGELALPFVYNDKPGSIAATMVTRGAQHDRIINADLHDFPAELFCMMTACGEHAFEGLMTAKVVATLDRTEQFMKAEVLGSTKELTVTAPFFEKPVKLKDSSLQLAVGDGMKRVTLVSAKLGLGGDTTVQAKGEAVSAADGWHIAGEGSTSRLDMNKLHLYWPTPMAPDTRAWVLSKLKGGYSESATLKVNLVPADLTGDEFNDGAIDSYVNARDIDFEYLPGFPEMHNMSGKVHFTGKTMTIESEGSGTLLSGTQVKKAKLVCPDLDDPYARMNAEVTLTAPAADVASILKLDHFTFDDDFNLDPAAITGTFDATLKLGFDGFSPNAPKDPNYVNLDKVSYDIAATLTNIAQPKLFEGHDIAGLSGDLTATNKATHFNGNVKLEGGTDLAIVLDDADGPGNTSVAAKGSIGRAQFATFGIPDMEELGDGSMGVDVELGMHDKGYDLKRADIDFTNMALDVHGISWSKEKGKAASLKLAPSKDPRSYDLSFDGPDLSVSGGSLTLNEAMDDIDKLTLGNVKNADNDFGLIYQTTAEGYNVTLTGKKLDASVEFAKPGSGLLANFPPINLAVDLNELALVKTQPLRNVKGRLHCNAVRCESANLTAQTGKASVIGTITRDKGARTLSITANDAGDFLRGLDITDKVYGGQLSLKGPYNDGLSPPKLDGRLIIEKFKLKNSQILARILSIGSLSGLVNVLTGAGIDFEKMGADMDAQGGIIKVSKGRAESNALGITVEGKVDTTKSGLNLKGVVVPANMLNSILNKLPIIGALAGGEGEGLIAFNYSVKGTYADPQVFVNPLSGLTPGFLRGIWGNGGSTDDVPDATKTDDKSDDEEKTDDAAPAATSPSPAHDVSSPPTASQSLVPDHGK